MSVHITPVFGLSRREMLSLGAASLFFVASPMTSISFAWADSSELGENQVYLVEVCESYQHAYYYEVFTSGTFDMGGVSYSHGFTTMGYGDKDEGNLTYFNLEGKYTTLSFVAGLAGNSMFADPRSADVVVSLDGTEVLAFTISPDSLPEEYTIDVTGASQLRFSVYSGVSVAMYDSTYGFANMILTTAASESSGFAAVPDGQYAVDVVDASGSATVRIEIDGGLVSSIDIESTSGSVSIEALYSALGEIVSENGGDTTTGTKVASLL